MDVTGSGISDHGEIRLELAEDLEFVSSLRKAAAQELYQRRGGPELLRELEHGDPAPVSISSIGLVALWSTVKVGYLHCRIVARGREHLVGVLDCLYVDIEFRRLGLGTHLLEVVSQLLISQGCTEVEVVVLPGDAHAKNLFESFGYKARAIVMKGLLNP